MRLSGAIFVATLVLSAEANPQGINFGSSSTEKKPEEDIANRNYGQQSSPQIQQFDYVFSNGTGARCWTAGWGKDEFSGSFQFIQHKVDVPLVPASQCNTALKRALNQKKPGVGDRFQLTQGEVSIE